MGLISFGVLGEEEQGDCTIADCLSAALDHGAYTANGIASYIPCCCDAAGQHSHGSILDIIRDEARHICDVRNYQVLGQNSKRYHNKEESKSEERCGNWKGWREDRKSTNPQRTRMMEEEEKDSRPRPAPSSSITVHEHPLQLFPQTWHDIEDLGQGTETRGVRVT